MKKIFDSEYLNIGSGIQPFNAWLLIRGLRTLPARLQQITESTFRVVNYLKAHPKIESVLFPHDESFPQYQLAKQQMAGACGLFTIIPRVDRKEQVETFCESLRHIMMAVSWGGHESLVIPKCAGIRNEDFDPGNREHRYVRMYVGLEDPGWLISDLEQALENI